MQKAECRNAECEGIHARKCHLGKKLCLFCPRSSSISASSKRKKEYVLSKQFLRSATSIGANVHEANNAQSKKDFISKMYISYKEATETEYWIKLLTETEYFTEAEGSSLLTDCVELKQILTAILKSAKRSV